MRPYTLTSLRKLLEEGDDEMLENGLSRFTCSRDSDRERFLHDTAVVFEKKGLARTYLAVMEGNIAGYFTVSIKCMRMPKDASIPNSLYKKMNVDSGNDIAQSYLLGQLGRADGSYKGLGSDLIEDALDVVKSANWLVGCRVVRIDCNDGLIPYYERHGFKYVCVSEPGPGMASTNQMVQIV